MFVVQIAEVIGILAAGQGNEAKHSLYHLLHSPTFDIEVLENELKSMSYCKNIYEKLYQREFVKNGFKEELSTFLRESNGQAKSGPVDFQQDVVEGFYGQVKLAEKEDSFKISSTESRAV